MSGDPLANFLVAGLNQPAAIDPNLLKLAAKRAAHEYLTQEGNESLTEVMAKHAAQIEGVQNEHIRRLCEFANNAVHDRLFDAETQEKDGHIVSVNFDPADPAKVIQRLNDGTKVAHVLVNGIQDYELPPPNDFTSEDDELLQHMFLDKTAELAGTGQAEFNHPVTERGVTFQPAQSLAGEITNTPDPLSEAQKLLQKKDLLLKPGQSNFEYTVSEAKLNEQDPRLQKISAASVALPRTNPNAALFELRTEIDDWQRALSSQLDVVDARADDCWRDFYGHVKQAMLEGHDFGDVVEVCEHVCGNNIRALEATVKSISSQLMQEKVASAAGLSAGLEKVSHVREVEPGNPIAVTLGGFLKLAGEHAKLESLVGQLQQGLREVHAHIRERVAPAGAAASCAR